MDRNEAVRTAVEKGHKGSLTYNLEDIALHAYDLGLAAGREDKRWIAILEESANAHDCGLRQCDCEGKRMAKKIRAAIRAVHGEEELQKFLKQLEES